MQIVYREDDLGKKRELYYELNYFSTAQLVLLRRELSKLLLTESSTGKPFDSRVLDLLFFLIGGECDRETVTRIAQNLLIDPGLQFSLYNFKTLPPLFAFPLISNFQ